MSVSVISACMNRVDPLSVSINSWVLFDEIDEIVFVDWSSDKSSDHLLKISEKIKRVYVPGQKYFNKTQSLNLAFSLTKGDKILNLDSDTILNPYYNFFKQYEIDDTCFVSGMYNPPHPCYRPLWGTLYLTRKNYQKIGGYNENMGEFVAWEDDEIVNRLLLCGLKHKKVRHTHQTAFTLSHDNKKRIENFEAYHTNQQIKEDLEKLLVKKSRDVDSYIDYAILSHHTVLNMKKYKRYKGDDFYVTPVVEWDIEQVDNQNYIARKITQ